MFEPIVPEAKLSSIYTYLYSLNKKDTMKRLLLKVCLDEVAGDFADNGLLEKIEK